MNGLDGASELRQDAVTSSIGDSSSVAFDLIRSHLPKDSERGESLSLI
ncbi:MAG TPA: hypothetical protein VHJ00_16595 [Bradyrhizobium sp.]|jgi:hypothetical protein|nr:hypothetical protein [Bradyrhizobium sp.]